ncbi:hypothetical protein [Nocardia sp. NPDC058633]|uniref:hypothetical protein n=1 Tax=Nocardia sp. NPDC058633 TaxID=3346568 RepID=UPI003658F638
MISSVRAASVATSAMAPTVSSIGTICETLLTSNAAQRLLAYLRDRYSTPRSAVQE